MKPSLNKINRLLRNSLLTGFWSRFTQPDRYSSFYFSTQTIARPLARPYKCQILHLPLWPYTVATDHGIFKASKRRIGKRRTAEGKGRSLTMGNTNQNWKLFPVSRWSISSKISLNRFPNQQGLRYGIEPTSSNYRPKRLWFSLWENVGNRSVTCWTLNRSSNIQKLQDQQQQNNRRRSNWEKGRKKVLMRFSFSRLNAVRSVSE